MNKLFRFIRTTTQFQPAQIRHKIIYELKKAKAGKAKFRLVTQPLTSFCEWEGYNLVPHRKTYQNGTFTFLNQSEHFDGQPDWNCVRHGSHWNICLNSFEYLRQADMNPTIAVAWMHSFIHACPTLGRGYDSYCVSQRLINWIPFISKHQISDPEIISFLHRQAKYLATNPEWHLKNNHLLENGFALVRAGNYFNDDKLLRKGENILLRELPLQVLADGAHVELSPMYHCIILWRILETISLLRVKDSAAFSALNQLLIDKAGLMCSWLMNIKFENGDLPNINDSSVEGIPSWLSLFQLADQLHLKPAVKPLGPSGLRKFHNRNFELLADVNGLTPSFAPGHSHADSLHFILHVFGDPFIIDTGVSTYEPGNIRDYERSTHAHNTVVINDRNQSEVYGRFRAGRKARAFIHKESPGFLEASHDGYKMLKAWPKRSFEFKEREIIIRDHVESNTNASCTAYFHIDKKCGLAADGNSLRSKFVRIAFDGASKTQISDKWFSHSFGWQIPSWKVKVDFTGTLVTRIFLP